MEYNTNVISRPHYLDDERKAGIRKKNTRQKKKINLFGYVLIFVIVIFLLSAGRLIWLNYQLNQEINFYLTQLENARTQHAQLLQEVEMAQSPAFIERVPRERLGMIREGEMIVRFTTPGYVRPLVQPAAGEILH